MDIFIAKNTSSQSGAHLHITGSKSESNRLLILKQLFPNLELTNSSTSDDSRYLEKVLNSNQELLDIGHAGTAMRFGTAFFASQPGVVKILTGSDRMKQRPIGVLVDALRELGAQISYLGAEGYPPLRIHGAAIEGGSITIDGSVSSQFITALLLTASSFTNGLEIKITNPTSLPYLKLTVYLIQELGISCIWEEHTSGSLIIRVSPTTGIKKRQMQVESDWSSAGYWYSWVAMQESGYHLKLSYYRENSMQGDSRLRDIYKELGVTTTFAKDSMTLSKQEVALPTQLRLDLRDVPDQAQTIFATCLGLGIHAHFTGLHTLKIKETDRIVAMQEVGSRFRESEILITDHSLELHIPRASAFNENVIVDTYHDHRMAMAFAPLCIKTSLIVKDATVVTKSYGGFWDDLKALNVSLSER